MQHPPSEDPSSKASNKQSLEVIKSDLNNSPIGQAGGNVNQASRDIINYFINSAQGDLSEEKIEKIRQFEESLRTEFEEKLGKAALLVNDLRACIEHQLTDGTPKDDETILGLLDELQAALGKESRLKLINEDLEFCHEGGLWLRENKRRLAVCAKDYVFKQRGASSLIEKTTQKLTVQELEARFVEDIETYIAWISAYLKTGATPQNIDFSDGLFKVYLDLPESYYKGAFEALNIDFVDPLVSGLSTGAANNIASYFNRFIIDRDLRTDIKSSAMEEKSLNNLSYSKLVSKRVLLVVLFLVIIIAILILR